MSKLEVTPTPQQLELLRRAASRRPWSTLEVWDVVGAAQPTRMDGIPPLERKAMVDPVVRECEVQGWLVRKVTTMREPPLWWVLTESGRKIAL